MNLETALQEAGCAIFWNGQSITSVERLPSGEYLLMTRRGVSIFQCMFVRFDYLEKRYGIGGWDAYSGVSWTPARVHFGPAV